MSKFKDVGTDYLSVLWNRFAAPVGPSPDQLETDRVHKELSATLTKEQKLLLLGLINSMDHQKSQEVFHSFCTGFRLALGILTQLYTDALYTLPGEELPYWRDLSHEA